MRPTRWIGAAIAAEVVVGVVAAILLQPPAPITVNQAVTKFRKQLVETSAVTTATKQTRQAPTRNAAPNPVPVRPAAAPTVVTQPSTLSAAGLVPAKQGVYVYDTSGQEHVDRPNKTTHSYPARSTMTASGSACDAQLTWEPMQGRSVEISGCYDHGAFRVTGMATTQTFFGYRTRSAYTCPGSDVAMPAAPKAGSTWQFDCDSPRTHAAVTVTVVGAVQREVSGTRVPTWHVRFDIALSGATRGTEVTDYWFAASDALPIAIASRTDVDEDTSFGTVHYSENYSLALAELKPRT